MPTTQPSLSEQTGTYLPLIDELLALPSVDQQASRLSAATGLTADGLSALLAEAERLVGANPEQAYKLARLCEHACLSATLFTLLPRTVYLQAQIHAIRGEFTTAQGLIETARNGYENLGMTLEALRTNVGLMRVLGETGHYVEALHTGQRALVQISVIAGTPGVMEPPDHRPVAAMLLQNCGACYEQIGRYEEALAAYAAAEARYQSLGMNEQQAFIIENRGTVLLAQGRVSDALAAFTYAQQIYAQAGLDFYQAQTLINIGEAHLLLSNYMPSLQAFAQALSLFAQLGGAVDQPILLRQMGDAYLALNLHAEALDTYDQAKAGLQAAGLPLHYALTLWGMGVTQIACNQLTAARQTLAAAAEIFYSLDNRPLLSALLLEESRLLEATGDTPNACRLAQQALALVEKSNWTVQKIYAYLRNADLALPDLAAAEQWLAAAQHWSESVDLPQLHYRLQQRWGHLRLLQGDIVAAQCHLEEAIDEIEQLRNTLMQEHLRASFLDDKRAAYQDLVQLHLLGDDAQHIEAAFAVTERAKSRALTDLISGAIQVSLDEPANDEFAVQLQAKQTELNAIYNKMLGSAEPSPHLSRSPSVALLKTRATELEQAISHLRLRRLLKQEVGDNAQAQLRSSPFPLFSAPGKPMLPSDMIVVVYHIVDEEVLAFICIGGELHLLRHLATTADVQQLLQRLTAQWARFRIGQPFIDRHQPQLEQSARRLLQMAYTALLAPVEALLHKLALCTTAPVCNSVRNLVIVPHRFLHQLPFHALYDGERYLIERYAISYAPSATVFALCQQRPLRDEGLALVVAAPDAQIPAATLEATQVAQHLRAHFADVRLLLNEEATLPAVTTLANQCSRLHLACHGLFRADNPLFSAIKLFDGWLTATHVAQLKLSAPEFPLVAQPGAPYPAPGALVTLSACESGRSQVMGGDENIGLVYAFLSAGAATLLVSQWLVHDEIAARFMDQWYTQLAGATDLAAALRTAQLSLLADYSHPYYWAPFVLIGQRSAKNNPYAAL